MVGARFEAEFARQGEYWGGLAASLTEEQFQARAGAARTALPTQFEESFEQQKMFWADANNSLTEAEFEAMMEDVLGEDTVAWTDLQPSRYKKSQLEQLLDLELARGRQQQDVKEKVKEKFKCDTCNLVFNTKQILMQHFLVHSKPGEAREWGCNFCKKCFKTASRLNLHMDMIHTVTPPIQCGECGKTFIRVGGLEKHRCRRK